MLGVGLLVRPPSGVAEHSPVRVSAAYATGTVFFAVLGALASPACYFRSPSRRKLPQSGPTPQSARFLGIKAQYMRSGVFPGRPMARVTPVSTDRRVCFWDPVTADLKRMFWSDAAVFVSLPITLSPDGVKFSPPRETSPILCSRGISSSGERIRADRRTSGSEASARVSPQRGWILASSIQKGNDFTCQPVDTASPSSPASRSFCRHGLHRSGS